MKDVPQVATDPSSDFEEKFPRERQTLGMRNELITPHECWLSLGASDNTRRSAYEGLFEDIRYGVRKGLPTGQAARKDTTFGKQAFYNPYPLPTLYGSIGDRDVQDAENCLRYLRNLALCM